MCDKILSRLAEAARTYGQSLATVVNVNFVLTPVLSDMEPLHWDVTIQLSGFGEINDGQPERLAGQCWTGKGETLKEALIAAGKHFREHITADLFIHKQKCADAEMALQEMDREVGNIWDEVVEAERALERIQE